MSSLTEPKRVLNVFSLIMINVMAVETIQTLPMAASYGFSLLALYLIGASLFFIPTALISAELATAWPIKGGSYVWVKEAFGPKVGFLVVYIQWIYNIVWYPTILSLVAATVTYLFDPSLIQNQTYMIIMVLSMFWGSTILNFFGMKTSSWVSTLGSLFGTLLPMALIALLAICWIMKGNAPATPITWSTFIPKTGSLSELVFFSAFLYGLLGLEMSAVHAQEVKNPERDYPRALLISVFVILISLVLSSIAVAVVVPKDNLDIVAGMIQAFTLYFEEFGLQSLTPLIALLIVVGGICQVATWIIGPTKGLWAAAHDGHMPKFLLKTNQQGVPTNMLLTQALISTILTSTFILLPSVKSSYWALFAMAAQLSLIMYAIIFASAIRLRYTRATVHRPYRIPFKNRGMWIVAGSGFLICISVALLGFIPPKEIQVGNIWVYEGILFGGITFILLPLLKNNNKKEAQMLSLEA